jgi:hypothetical protein
LKNNKIVKGLVPLEKLFDENDVAKNPRVTPNEAQVDDFNIWTNKEPTFVNFSKSLTPENRNKYLELMR